MLNSLSKTEKLECRITFIVFTCWCATYLESTNKNSPGWKV